MIVDLATGQTSVDPSFEPPPPEAPPTRWRILKSTLFRRTTAAEAAAIKAAVASLPADKEQLWQAARWFWSDDQDVLQMAAVLGFPAERVAALLAPDPDPELQALPV